MPLIYPPRAKSIFIHSSAPAAESEKDFPHWNPQLLGPSPPPTAQTDHALELSNPDKQWLHKQHVSKQHGVPCCPPAQSPGTRMSPNMLTLSISVPFSWSSKGSREGEESRQSEDPAHPHTTPGQHLQPLQETQSVFLTKQVLGTAGHMPTVPAEAGCWQTPSPGVWGTALTERAAPGLCVYLRQVLGAAYTTGR